MINKEELDQKLATIRAEMDATFPRSMAGAGMEPFKLKGLKERFERKTGIKLSEEIAEYFCREKQASIDILGEDKPSGKPWYIDSRFYDLDFMASGEQEAYVDGVFFGGYFFQSDPSKKYLGVLYDAEIDDETRNKVNSLFIWAKLGIGNFILIDLQEPNDNPEVYLWRYPMRLFKLKLRFWEYLDKLLEYRGVYLWEKYYTENPAEASHPAIRDQFHDTFQTIFPKAKTELPPPTPQEKVPNTFEILASQRNYAERFDRMVEDLRKREGFKVVNYDRWTGQSITGLQKGWYATRGLLTDDMLAFYSRIRCLKLHWQLHIGPQMVAEANFMLSPFDRMIGGPPPGVEYNFRWDWDANRQMAWKNPETVGMLLFSDGYFGQTLIQLDENPAKMGLYYVDHDQPYPLTIDFKEYIELLLENRGLWRWQYFFTDPDACKELPRPARFRMDMRKYFPEADMSRYRKV